jgi:succinate dehydrogenase/fumarate reductase flavoprotein subunit
MGGLRIDENAASSLPGLYAAGECTGGIHGANRLAGNALSENQVFGAIAGTHAAKFALRQTGLLKASAQLEERVLAPVRELIGRTQSPSPDRDAIRPSEGWKQVQSVMQRWVGATRTEAGLKDAISALDALRVECSQRMAARDASLAYNRDISRALELRNMIDTGWMAALAALERKESRGAHVRLDAPEENEEWTCSLAVSLSEQGVTLRKLKRGREAEA